jgi:hypothetical protein
MLTCRDNLDITFDYQTYEYFKGLKNSRNPNNKSYITLIDTNNDWAYAKRAGPHRDVYQIHELENDLVYRAMNAMHIQSLKFMLVFCVEPNTPVLKHTHTTDECKENHLQPVGVLTPSGSLNGLWIDDRKFDLVNRNHILLNVKAPHWVDTQNEPAIYLTCFGAVF